jgi:hypothetical protein
MRLPNSCRALAASTGFALGLLIAEAPISREAGFSLISPTFADDDGDDGGGAGGGGGGGGAGSGGEGSGEGRQFESGRQTRFTLPFGNIGLGWPWQQRTRRVVRSPAAPSVAAAARRELVIAQVDAGQLDRIRADGFQVLAERPLSAGRGSLLRLAPPRSLSTARALARLREIAPGRAADRNTIYTQRFQVQGARPSSKQVFGDPLAAVDWKAPESCHGFAAIGVIDTGIDTSHPGLAGKALETRVLRSPDRQPSSQRHGTAIATLFLGDGAFPGLARQARVIAIDAFHSKDGADQVDTFDLVAAMDALRDLRVAVINLSLAGTANEVLDAEGRLARAQGITVVAASGNDGAAAKPRYPAAYDWAVAVTAIDRDRNIYRRAVRGPHIRFAAPGVGVVLDDGKGQPRQHSGTSFAAPFVTARIALARSDERAEGKPEVAGAPVNDAGIQQQSGAGIEPLLAQAIDLGPPGKDNEFGNGLVQFGDACPSARVR